MCRPILNRAACSVSLPPKARLGAPHTGLVTCFNLSIHLKRNAGNTEEDSDDENLLLAYKIAKNNTGFKYI